MIAPTSGSAPQVNQLSKETSPYLLQHKDNPVHWWPWGTAAFEEARRTGKPILLSVGYAACHWCHVMAHESFEDEETARLMNELFVNIKVDREERPDVDALYMRALQALGEQGGWPLTMFLTPDGEPFWGGTYFPKTSRYGRPAFPDVLREVARVYREERDKVSHNARHLRQALTPKAKEGAPPSITEAVISQMARNLPSVIDPVNGGIQGAPKFPNTSIFAFLWRAGLRYDAEICRRAVDVTLTHIAQGGIYDHLGGGFARYAVDDRWLVPHFEKMLYDNALLIDLMTEVWKETRNPLYQVRVAESVGWLLREMVADGGGFASSLDADSEGEEGKFYVWSLEEVFEVLGPDDGAFFAEVYDITAAGNWEGKNIPNRLNNISLRLPEDEERLRTLRIKLLAAREQRVRPGWDDKILADWNGLAIVALAKAACAFDRPDWLAAAKRAYDFVKTHMSDGGRLLHSYRAGRANAPAVATDYANMVAAALELYMIAAEEQFLSDARSWTGIMDRFYWSQEHGGYYLAARDTQDIIIPTLSARDDATPNANATMLSNLMRLYLLTGDSAYEQRAHALVDAFGNEVMQNFVAHAGFLDGLMTVLAPQHIVIVSPGGASGAHAMRGALQEASIPGAVVQMVTDAHALPARSPAHGKTAINGAATAYVCIGPQCAPPVTSASELPETLRKLRRAVPAQA